ncbi:MAG TPA: c-type cytochrome [Noviherbaspirillum sp.]
MMFNVDRSLAALAAALVLSVPSIALASEEAQVDAEAAERTARREDCFKCHGLDKAKEGPSFKKIASKLKNKPDAAAKVREHLTSGVFVTMASGDEDEHRIIKSTDENEISNLIRWVLSR